MAKPLYDVAHKAALEWAENPSRAFKAFKELITTPPALAYPDFDRLFKAYTYAQGHGLGVILAQINEAGEEHPIAYGVRAMKKAESNHTITEKEGLAVVISLNKCRHYLLPSEFEVIVNHQPLKHIFSKNEIKGRLARWLLLLAEHCMKVVYRKGKKHKSVDAISRLRPKDLEPGSD